jgi:hypothetical protein
MESTAQMVAEVLGGGDFVRRGTGNPINRGGSRRVDLAITALTTSSASKSEVSDELSNAVDRDTGQEYEDDGSATS